MAVYEFLKALSPNSKVQFDRKIRDRDTGRLRQVDAWIDLKIGTHIPVSILISCKDYKRKLSGQIRCPAIDTYNFNPGFDWFEIQRNSKLLRARMVAIFTRPDIEANLREHFKDKTLI